MLRVKSSVLAPSLTRTASGVGLDDVAHGAQRAVKVHRAGVGGQRGGHLGLVLVLAVGDAAHPVGGRLGPAAPHALHQRRDAGTDVADERRGDGHVAVDLGRRDVDLDELLGALVGAPGLALAVREQPVQPRAHQQHHVGLGQHVAARGRRRQFVRVGQQALGHGHRQVGDAAGLDQRAHGFVGAGVGGALAEQDQRPLRPLEQVQRARHRLGRGQLARRRVDDLDQRPLAGFGRHGLREQLGRQVEVDAARAARQRRTDRAGHADADVLRVQHPEGRLAQRLGDGQLVHLLVVALLQVDDLALGRTADEDHREAVGGGVGQRRQAVQEARRRHRQADARLGGEEAGRRGGIAGVLLVAEGDDPHALGLRLAREVGDGNARQPEDGVDAVELQGVDDEMETVGHLAGLRVLAHGGLSLVPGFGVGWKGCGRGL